MILCIIKSRKPYHLDVINSFPEFLAYLSFIISTHYKAIHSDLAPKDQMLMKNLREKYVLRNCDHFRSASIMLRCINIDTYTIHIIGRFTGINRSDAYKSFNVNYVRNRNYDHVY